MGSYDNIKMPNNIDEITKKSIEKGIKFKKNSYKKRFIKVAAIVAISILSVSTVGVIAIENESIKGIFEEVNNILNFREKGNFKSVNETIVKNGISIKIEDVFTDELGIYVCYEIRSNESFKNTNDDAIVMYEKAKFNNKKLVSDGEGGISGKFLNDSTFVGIEKYIFKDVLGDEKTGDLKINIDAVSLDSINDDAIVNGSWDFNIPINIDEDKIINIEPETSKNGLYISKIMLGKANMIIDIGIEGNQDINDLKISDNYGREVIVISREELNNNLFRIRGKSLSENVENLVFSIGNENIKVNIK